MSTRPPPFSTGPAPDAPDDPTTTGFARSAAGLPAPRLWRSRGDRVVAGVLGGLAEKFGVESRPLRLLYGLLTVVSGGLLAVPYVAIWAITRAHGARRAFPRMWRSRSEKVVAGVLGGLAEKFDVHPTFLRVLFVTASVLSGAFPGVLTYLILWMITRPLDLGEERDIWT